jgi:hypothetical protein
VLKGQSLSTGLPDFPWYNVPKREKYSKNIPYNMPNGHKISQIATKYTKMEVK